MRLLFGLTLSYLGFLTSQTLVLATPIPMASHNLKTLSQQVNFNPPKPPADPPPGGRVLGGAKRGSCPQVKQDLTALVPFTQEPPSVTNVWSLTTSAHPTFWFYVPYSQTANLPAMFVLQDQQSKDLYKQPIALPNHPGIISVSLPANTPGLAVNQQYRWFLTFACETQEDSPPIYVEGVIQRVKLSREITQELQTATPLQQFAIYAQNGIWHEAITTLAKLRQEHPQDPALKTQWQNLLASIRLGNVATEPILSDKH
ncbi:hypothetical protein NIES2109_10540 [Nostoc sp. HK-01]|uniref:DUF928 domain-containing protein n=1 Tax=Nostoc cycadae WK-1 TaxID=1861711 RepID=A0A2H6LDH1_9NOSO|nr:DUF928 domain-containing protein [Nostoc cycadae]BBD58281.1 hypothetical protein NIES2109_10540 [Nostoc sp. HK-01]GBE91186.1 hypothetical protein NCWK1_0908 [Nostoc cycadae WK-1]